MNYLFDTCVISELVSKEPNEHVIEWIDALDENRVFLSVITIGEIQKGISKLSDSKRKTQLTYWLNNDLLVRFSRQILPIDTPVMIQWGHLIAALEVRGKMMSALDALIAIIAQYNDLSLVTRNEKDFEHIDVMLINPWQ